MRISDIDTWVLNKRYKTFRRNLKTTNLHLVINTNCTTVIKILYQPQIYRNNKREQTFEINSKLILLICPAVIKFDKYHSRYSLSLL